VKTAAASADPNVRNATFVKGNVVWIALNRVGGTISREERELIMSVIGTVVLYPPEDDGSGATPRYVEPSIVGLRDLLLGRGNSAAEGNVDIEVYRCDEPRECLNPVRTTVSVKPFTRLVSERLRRMSDHIATRTPQSAAKSADPNVRNVTFVKGNVTWLALNHVGGTISREERELIMSVIGTVILTPPADDGSGATPRYVEPTIVGLRDLLLGRGASATDGNVDLEVYVCDEPAECLNPARTTVSVKPFTRLVTERLRRMSDNIVNRTPQSAADIGFINNTTEPVYKMLAVANAIPGSSTAETLIETYKDVIALDYAETFLNRSIRQALSALSQALKRTGIEQQYVDSLRQNAQEAQRQLLAEKQTAYAKVRSVSSMTQDLQSLERQLWSSMPPAVKAMLDFSANSGARGS
jgi:hypothetical protein